MNWVRHPSYPAGIATGFESRIAGHSNTDQWGFAFTLTTAGTILDEQYVLVLDGSDFVARHRHLRVENFEDSVNFLSAARAILGANPDETAVKTLMAQAGMLPGSPFAVHDLGDGRRRLRFYQWGNLFSLWSTGCRQMISVNWVFDPKIGRLTDAKPGEEWPCMTGPA